MRVAFLLSSLQMGGAERNVLTLMPHLRARGVQSTLFTLSAECDGPLAAELSSLAIERIDLSAARLFDVGAHRRLTAILRRRGFDLLHAQDQYAIISGAAAHWRTGIPFVITRHVMEEPTDTWRRLVRARMVLAAARHSTDAIVAVSHAASQRFAVQSGAPVSRIHVIPNGIELARFAAPRREAIRIELGWPAAQPVVIMVAVFRPGKGHDLLLAAAARMREALPQIRIVLVGEGPLRPAFARSAASLGAAVEFLGERADVPKLLAASDVLVLPSENEALPTVLIEAGAASLPVVATRVGGVAEIVEDGRTGHLIDRGDAAGLAERTIGLLGDRAAAGRMGRAAQRRVQELFSVATQASRTVALYGRVLGRA